MSSLRIAQGIPSWMDQDGGRCKNWIGLFDQSPAVPGGFEDVFDAMDALSSCGADGLWISRWHTSSTVPVAGVYPTVRDKAVFDFRSASGVSRIRVPGPLAAIFLSDNRTVDMSNSLVVAFVSSVISNCSDSSGHPIISCVRGWRAYDRTGLLVP